jgi:hypothetical protein
MSSAAAIVACALAILGESERTMPRIALVDVPPIGTSAQVEAFVRQSDRTIYLVTSSQVFREAMSAREECGDRLSVRKLASILAHEEWHIKHGPDEKGAYQAQLTTLIRIGVQPGSGLYASVVKSMQAVLKKQRYDRPDIVVADNR